MKHLLLALALLCATPAFAHDPGTAKSPEEARVFTYYTSWMRPPERSMSCCSQHDCHDVEVKRQNGKWFFLDKISSGSGPYWREIPEDRLEQNDKDPRESPDGRSHVCFNSSFVLCAVLGSGQ